MGTSLISLNRKGMENNGQFVAEEIAIVAWFGTNLNDPKVPKALCSQFCGTHGRAGMNKTSAWRCRKISVIGAVNPAYIGIIGYRI